VLKFLLKYLKIKQTRRAVFASKEENLPKLFFMEGFIAKNSAYLNSLLRASKKILMNLRRSSCQNNISEIAQQKTGR
jgi:hypothetical protein